MSRDLNASMEISILRFPFTYHVIQNHMQKRVNTQTHWRKDFFFSRTSVTKEILHGFPGSFYNKSCFATARIILSLMDLARYLISWIGPQIFTIVGERWIRCYPLMASSTVPLECPLMLPQSFHALAILETYHYHSATPSRFDISLNKSYADRQETRNPLGCTWKESLNQYRERDGTIYKAIGAFLGRLGIAYSCVLRNSIFS